MADEDDFIELDPLVKNVPPAVRGDAVAGHSWPPRRSLALTTPSRPLTLDDSSVRLASQTLTLPRLEEFHVHATWWLWQLR